jgi:hypothetical protein
VFLHGFENTELGWGHWNAQGHRLAAALIARWLTKQGAVHDGATHRRAAS